MIDVPPEPVPSQEQVIEQRLLGCGLNPEGFTVKYEDYLQSIEIVIGSEAGASEESFDCIRQAAGYEIVTFEERRLQAAYTERSAELVRPRLLADARSALEKRGLLEGFPDRSDYLTDKLFAEALERHCGAEPGSFFVESQGGLVARPSITRRPPTRREYDKTSCLLSAMMYASAKGETFKVGFIGNEMPREEDGD